MSTWVDDVVATVRAALGDETADTITARWEEHADRATVEVTFFGPYDAGKSSLLKRILHEDGVAVPPWLTVSARRETWETNEVNALGMTFTDTPGIAGGNSEHEELATDTVTLTDALVVVLPPQLVTGERDVVLGLLSGAFFTGGRSWPYPVGAIRAVLTRMDDGGFDPSENPSGYRDFARGKVDELRALLRSAGLAEDLPVSTVVPDPYGMVGGALDVDYYDLGDLDGMPGLIAELRELEGRKQELRDAARIRYFLHAARRIADRLEQHVGRLDLEDNELARRIEEHRSIRSEVDALIEAARASLKSVVIDEAQAVAERVGRSAEDLEPELRRRLDGRVGAWQQQWDLELSDLAVRLGERYDANRSRPMAELLGGLFEPAEAVQPTSDGVRTWDLMQRSGPLLQRAVRDGIAAKLGMSLEEARKELGRLEGLDPDQRAAEFAKKGAKFASQKKYDDAARVVGVAGAAVDMAPIALDLARGLHEIVKEGADARRHADELDATRKRAREAAERISNDIVDGVGDASGWSSAALALSETARDTEDLLAKTLDAVRADRERQSGNRLRLAELVNIAPRPADAA